jgi:hypothetical protein
MVFSKYHQPRHRAYPEYHSGQFYVLTYVMAQEIPRPENAQTTSPMKNPSKHLQGKA